MRVDWCVSSWFRIKNTHSHTPPKSLGRCGSARDAVAISVAGALLGVGGAVAVRVGVEVVGRAVAVSVNGALLGIGHSVAVRVGVLSLIHI